MIPRNIPKNKFIGESVLEASFIASKGIDETKAPTQRDTLTNIKNLEVNYDGSLSPRKPLIINCNIPEYDTYLGAAYNGDYITLHNENGEYYIHIYNHKETSDYSSFDIVLLNSDPKIVNTTSSTILQNCVISEDEDAELATFKLVHDEVESWKIEQMTLEINTLNFVDGNPQINPNLMLNNAFNFRDIYNSSAIYPIGILAYIKKDPITGEVVIPDTTNLSTTSIADLTESDNFKIIESIPKNVNFSRIYLKCFMNNIDFTNMTYSVWIRWERTSNGIIWDDAENLTYSDNIKYIEVPSTLIDGSLDSSEDVSVSPRLFKRYIVTDENDYIANRPDVLVLSNLNDVNYSYRCLVYILKDMNEVVPECVVTGTPILKVDGLTASNNALVTPAYNAELVRKFELTFSVASAENVTISSATFSPSSFTCKVSTKCGANNMSRNYNIEDVTTYGENFTIETLDVNTYKITGYLQDDELDYALTNATIATEKILWKYDTNISVFYNNKNIHLNINYKDNIKIIDYPQAIIDNITLELNIPLSNPTVSTNALTYYYSRDKIVQHLDDLVYVTNSSKWYKFDYFKIKGRIGDTTELQNYLSDINKIKFKDTIYSIKIKETYVNGIINGIPYTREYTFQASSTPGDTTFTRTINSSDETTANKTIYNIFNRLFTNNVTSGISYAISFSYNGATYSTYYETNGNSFKNQCFDFINGFGVYFDIQTRITKDIYITRTALDRIYNSDLLIYNKNQNYYVYLSEIVSGLFIADIGFQTPVINSVYSSNLYVYISNNYVKDAIEIYQTMDTIYTGSSNDILSRDVQSEYTNSLEYDPDYTSVTNALEGFQVGLVLKDFLKNSSDDRIETLYLDLGANNANKGYKLYWNHRIVSYGAFNNNILFSNSDSLVTPMLNTLTLNASQDSEITSVIPWRNYLIATTKEAVYLIYETEGGFGHKTINTFIGVPEQDRRTCKAILNGIIFKSNNKIYTLQPGIYSNDDSILNIAEISQPIESLLSNVKVELEDDFRYDANFAISTSKYYYMFIPGYPKNCTTCFKYDYVRKIWTTLEYPLVFTDYIQTTEDELYLIDRYNNVYQFEKDFTEFVKNNSYDDTTGDPKDILYGDYLKDSYSPPTPIEFSFDSGQKTDNISTTKQFVETKIIVATMDDLDSFPLDVDIYIDGIKFKNIHTDINTDGAVLKRNTNDSLILGTNTTPDDIDLLNTFRQMILRYSLKGKSIRHIVSGSSMYNFKVYVTYYRYKLTHNKQ